MLPLARHPQIDSRVIVFDLDSEPDALLELEPDAIAERLYIRQADLPEGDVELMVPPHDMGEPVAKALPVDEAIEQIAYDLLGQKHCGWENNDGAYGEFSFHVAEGRIELDYNERISASEHYGHEW